ncbi:DUF4184 family protein [Goodfellowiella coeruleoviolacea]|uniref:DUF4184 family protein n=1 Tax=Goodfellowiella coeruleoviolacea TaxID=334858 RepID=A0AAE3GFJ2_9PSEU|nr:DUF4184 family protein [Goodfellowiella coeruleoviolacea]MCP2166434.1 protein of unknown function (DUF4184) [Goodfellowiella coeruleoviolacea]
MPFTFAHPAAVLPLRRVLWFPGLVAGSVAPDIAYYLPLPGGPDTTHSVVGLVGADLLLGALLVVLGRLVLAPLLALAPAGWGARTAPPGRFTRIGWRSQAGASATPRLGWLVGAGSVVVGAATHAVWDAFTQTHGAAVRHWPLLRVSVVGPHRLYNVIGYVSSLGGLLVLAAVAVAWYRRAPREHGESWRRLSGAVRGWALGAVAVGAAAGAGLGLTDPVSQVSAYDWVRQLLLGGVRGAGLAVALHVLAWYATKIGLTPTATPGTSGADEIANLSARSDA